MKKTVPLKKNFEFARLYKKGRFFVGKYLVLYVLPNRQGINRLGITASKKFGKSVKRNRIRRLIKEVYMYYEDYITEGYDLVFVARNTQIMPEYSDIKKEMRFLLKGNAVFDWNKWDNREEH